jgi:Raf kinase inhibitor-like YbhB/YbcL family protein
MLVLFSMVARAVHWASRVVREAARVVREAARVVREAARVVHEAARVVHEAARVVREAARALRVAAWQVACTRPRMKRALCLIGFASAAVAASALAATFALSSPKLNPDGSIPKDYTCDGKGASLPLAWTEPPAGTRSLALVVDDPDAPKPPFVHWLVYDIPARARGVDEGKTPDGARQGTNSASRAAWAPPCPPNGTHHYVFTLYALDATIDAKSADEPALLRAMKGHVLGEAKMTATYAKQKP